MSSIVPTTAAEHLPAPGDDAAESERLHRNLTPAIAELGEASHFLRYAVGALAAMLVLLALVFAFNAIVDPLSFIGWRILPPAVETDRSIKLDLIQKLKTNPQVVVLGSSRSRQA